VNAIDPEALLTAIDAGRAPVVLDVRSAGEFARGHVPGAVHLPFWRAWRRGPGVPGDPRREVVVYCGHGPRAWVAAALLRQLGVLRLRFLRGHMAGWRRAGLREGRRPLRGSHRRVPDDASRTRRRG
jgi:rhodanese-related sulfurtransferase